MKKLLRVSLATLALVPMEGSLALARGWHAVQSHQTTGSKTTQKSELYYARDKLRINADNDKTSVVVDIDSGKFTFLDHPRKRYASITFEELVALRDRTIAEMKAQLPKMPPAIRQSIEERLKALEDPKAQAAPKLKPLGKKTRIGKFDCERYAWDSADGSGEACISKKPGVDITEFVKASGKLSKRLAKLGAGSAAGDMAILQLAEYGLPVETRRKLSFAGSEVETTTTITSLETAEVPDSQFAAPKDYGAETFEDLMRSQSQPTAGPTPAPAPSPAPTK
ncbi:MAG: DUF4412 domain-containing protein [Deltaproteobacteria bacterium]|nr:DUF4412 domain-containing protein [Deltaproteobacteria bacterium]